MGARPCTRTPTAATVATAAAAARSRRPSTRTRRTRRRMRRSEVWGALRVSYSLYHQLCVPFPRNVTRKTHPVYKGPHISDRHVTFLEILFQNIYMCTFAGIASEENNSRSSTLISTLGLFLFIRHHLRIPIWFQILHLLI